MVWLNNNKGRVAWEQVKKKKTTTSQWFQYGWRGLRRVEGSNRSSDPTIRWVDSKNVRSIARCLSFANLTAWLWNGKQIRLLYGLFRQRACVKKIASHGRKQGWLMLSYTEFNLKWPLTMASLTEMHKVGTTHCNIMCNMFFPTTCAWPPIGSIAPLFLYTCTPLACYIFMATEVLHIAWKPSACLLPPFLHRFVFHLPIPISCNRSGRTKNSQPTKQLSAHQVLS